MFVAAQALSGGSSHAKSLLDAHSHELGLELLDDMEELDLESRLSDQQLAHFRRQLSRMRSAYDAPEGDAELTSYTFDFIAGDVHRKHQALNLTVHARIFGTTGQTDEFTFRPATSSSVAASVRVQVEDLPQVGDILAVALGHGDNGSQRTLFLDRFTVTNDGTGAVVDVPCFSWFSRSRGDHNLFRICWAFSQQHEDEPRMRLTVNDVRHEEDFTLYSIVVESGRCKWRVWKRYSDLLDLHEALKKSVPDKERAALFPKKHLRKLDANVIQDRVAAFKEWLRRIVHDSELMKIPEVRGTLQTRPPCIRIGTVSIGNKKEVTPSAQEREEEDQESDRCNQAEESSEVAPGSGAMEDPAEEEDSSDEAGQAMEMAPVEQ